MVNILIGCSGSVAALKLPILIEKLVTDAELNSSENVEVRVITTQHAQHFYKEDDLPKNVELYKDEDEWTVWSKRGDPVLHIELSKWADVFVIAPLDANTLAKVSNGLCDNLLTCTARAWDISKPFIFCPAMNTKMYHHPITEKQISVLQSWGYHLVPVIQKTLICGDNGLGAMAEVETIVDCVKKIINKNN